MSLHPICREILKDCCTTTCFIFSLKITWYLKVNLGLSRWTPTLTSFYQLSITMYKSFIRLHLDYDDIFDLAFNKSFHDNLEAIEYSASLARTAAIRGTSREKLYQELSLESLQQWCWFRKLCTFCKIYKNQSPLYLCKLLLLQTSLRFTRSSNNVPCFHFKVFQKLFFLFCSFWTEQSRRNAIQRISTRTSKILSIFNKRILQFIRPSPSFNNTGIKHFTRLRLGLSHLRDQKFKLGFFDSLNPICSCELDIETTCHHLLHCPNIRNERSDLLNIVSTINKDNLKCALLLPNFSFMVTSC